MCFWRGGILQSGSIGLLWDRLLGFVSVVDLPQRKTGIANARFYTALNFFLRNVLKHLDIGSRRLGTEVAVVSGKVTEVFGDPAHGAKRVVKPLQRTTEGAVRNGQYFVRTSHSDRFLSYPATMCLPRTGSEIEILPRNSRDIFTSQMWRDGQRQVFGHGSAAISIPRWCDFGGRRPA